MSERRKNRSQGYQYVVLEQCVCPHVLADLSSAQGLTCRIQAGSDGGGNGGGNDGEDLLVLKEKLSKRMWEIIDLTLTERQKEVLKLSVINGRTQNEIAKMLGINQTSVHKVLKGNIDYKNGKKRYGGAIKKIIKFCHGDPQINDILDQIRDAMDDDIF